MGLTNDERSSLVELRLEKAKRFIAEAEQMLSMELWDLAANRFYYSCFHAAQALLIHYGLSAHTHACLLYTSPSPRDGLLSRMPSSA